MSDTIYMKRCFQLAEAGSGNVAPNPLVGAVLVHNERIIAEGFHMKYGGPHAEVIALSKVNDVAILEKSTLYVNLEPCSHTGKTPPCTNLIIAKGIKHVVIANKDPFYKVNGSGIAQLQNAGISVRQGILENEGKLLNKRFFTFHTKKRPYIILKWAETPDGFIAPLPAPDSKQAITWISNPTSRLMVHRWRSEEQAILVGRGTVLSDNPRLNVRGITGNDPVRIIIDPKLTLPKDAHVFDNSSKTIIFNFRKDSVESNTRYIKIAETKDILPVLLKELYKLDIQSVLVEGGATTFSHFIKSRCWDEARIFTGRISFDMGVPAPLINGLNMEQHDVDGDTLRICFNPFAC